MNSLHPPPPPPIIPLSQLLGNEDGNVDHTIITNDVDKEKHMKSSNKMNNRFLSLGDSYLDELMEGGIPYSSGLVEIAGEAGVGKTQLLLTLLLTSITIESGSSSNNNNQSSSIGGAVYVSTEGSTHLARLQSLIEARKDSNIKLDYIFAYEMIEPQQLWEFIMNTLPLILATRVAKLVVIDSITAPLRGEFERVENRMDWFFGLASAMKRLSDEYNVLFIVSNQMSWDPVYNMLKPALGLAWTTCVNERLLLEFEQQHHQQQQQPRKRILSISFSPRLLDGKLASLRLEGCGFCI
jgi:RecA/RadA recombinase